VNEYQSVKTLLAHFFQPLKSIFMAVGGGVATLEMTDQLSGAMAARVIEFVALALVVRTILFFEFRVHERKEQNLLTLVTEQGERREKRLEEMVGATGKSFDYVAGTLREEVNALKKLVEALTTTVATLAKSHEEDHGVLRAIQQSPLVQRIIAGTPREGG
jgi:hypothetical protein